MTRLASHLKLTVDDYLSARMALTSVTNTSMANSTPPGASDRHGLIVGNSYAQLRPLQSICRWR